MVKIMKWSCFTCKRSIQSVRLKVTRHWRERRYFIKEEMHNYALNHAVSIILHDSDDSTDCRLIVLISWESAKSCARSSSFTASKNSLMVQNKCSLIKKSCGEVGKIWLAKRKCILWLRTHRHSVTTESNTKPDQQTSPQQEKSHQLNMASIIQQPLAWEATQRGEWEGKEGGQRKEGGGLEKQWERREETEGNEMRSICVMVLLEAEVCL